MPSPDVQSIDSARAAPARRLPGWPVRLLLCAYGFNGAAGTTLEYLPFYLVPGISWLDVIVALDMVRLTVRGAGRGVWTITRVELHEALLMSAFATWLIASTMVNSYRFETPGADLLPALKVLYFVVLMMVIRRYVSIYGIRHLTLGFLAGVTWLSAEALSGSTKTVVVVPLLLNPNVVGALMGLGVWFAALSAIVTRRMVLNLLAALALSALSITTFSKGAWLMCAFGLLVFVVVPFSRRRTGLASRWKRAVGAAVVVSIVAGVGALVWSNRELLDTLIAAKLRETVTSGSVSVRYDLARAALYAGLDNPVFGLGYRNFYMTQAMYPELHLPNLGRFDNAHNLFAQTLAVSGFPGLTLLGLVFLLPFVALWRKMKSRLPSPLARAAVWVLSLLVWFTYGAVQLQMTAQPPFWIFCGMIFGIPSHDESLSGRLAPRRSTPRAA